MWYRKIIFIHGLYMTVHVTCNTRLKRLYYQKYCGAKYSLDSMTLTLSNCNLAIRGHREKVYGHNSSPKGNLLSIFELLAKHDRILQKLLSKSKVQIKYSKVQKYKLSLLLFWFKNWKRSDEWNSNPTILLPFIWDY